MVFIEKMLKGIREDFTLKTWFKLKKLELMKAYGDTIVSTQCLTEKLASSPMIYCMLANMTKDGYVRSNLFQNADGSVKTADETRNVIPFKQMARMVQVTIYVINVLVT